MKHGGPEFTSVHVCLLDPEQAHGSNYHCVCSVTLVMFDSLRLRGL